MEKIMCIETLGESLQAAVDQAFVLDCDLVADINEEVSQYSKRGLDMLLEVTAANKQTGLRYDLAKAYASGDTDDIELLEKMATVQAQAGVMRRAARIAVHNSIKDSRIGHSKPKKWNGYGYAL